MSKTTGQEQDIEVNTRLPRHIAIIMDGNGRWAKSRGLSRSQGHMEGVKRAEAIVDLARCMGIEVLTLFTFSTENWNRPQNEVSTLMNIITVVLQKKLEKLSTTNVRFRLVGRLEGIPSQVLDVVKAVEEKTTGNTGMVLNLAFNYGARNEIIDAIKGICGQVQRGELAVNDINESTVTQALYTKDLPDPDLLIRTSGEKRISNFLLWQLSYAELYFTETFWPDFSDESFKQAINEYQHRERRFGNLGGKDSAR